MYSIYSHDALDAPEEVGPVAVARQDERVGPVVLLHFVDLEQPHIVKRQTWPEPMKQIFRHVMNFGRRQFLSGIRQRLSDLRRQLVGPPSLSTDFYV